jgi:hypothetical protein
MVPECGLFSLFRVERQNGPWEVDICGDIPHLK